jgi:hypothetical protein
MSFALYDADFVLVIGGLLAIAALLAYVMIVTSETPDVRSPWEL